MFLNTVVARLAALSPLSMGVTIFLVALAVRTAMAFWLGLYGQTIGFGELQLIGKSIAETGVFGNPYKIPTGPTAHGAPFYPYVLSVVFKIFGYGREAQVTVLGGAAIFTALSFALLPLLAVRVGLPVWVGGVAGMLGAVLPFRAITELIWEVPYAVTGWIVTLLLTIGWLRNPGVWKSLACGAAWGALFWVAPQFALSFVLILVTSIWTLGWSTARKAVPLVGLAAAMVIFPWIWRNHHVFGAWFFVRGNLGLELAVGNFPGASADYVTNCIPPDPERYCIARHPFTSAAEAATVRDLGEIAYNRLRMAEAMSYITADPAAFLIRTGQRIGMFWFVRSGGLPAKDLVLYPLTILAFFGVWRMLRQIPDAGRVFLCCLIAYPVPYYLVAVSTRYIVPLGWLILFLAVYGVAMLVPYGKLRSLGPSVRCTVPYNSPSA